MSYKLEILPSAANDLDGISKKIQRQIDEKILALAENPRPSGTKKLKSKRSLWRIRCGDHRIIYAVDDNNRIVMIVEIGHRREVYRGL